MHLVGLEISFFKTHCPPHRLVIILMSRAGLHKRLLMALSRVTTVFKQLLPPVVIHDAARLSKYVALSY